MVVLSFVCSCDTFFVICIFFSICIEMFFLMKLIIVLIDIFFNNLCRPLIIIQKPLIKIELKNEEYGVKRH